LVELLVVLAIIGLLVTAMPTVIATVAPSMRLKASARSLADALRAIRGTAILEGRETSLTLNLATGQYQTIAESGTRGLPPGVALSFEGPRTEVDGETATMRFYPDGSSTGGRVVLSMGHNQHSVVAHWLSGRISVDE
jgi:general secretion pathway protein H